MTGRLAGLLWVLALLLAAGVAAEWAQAPEPPALSMPRLTAMGAASAAAPEPAAAEVQTALARPLFAPSRRPPADAAVPGSAAGPDEPPRLTGILLSAADRRAIFAAAGGDGHSAVVGEGGQVGPWHVERIAADRVELSGPDGRRELRPAFAEGVASAGLPGPQGGDRTAPGFSPPPLGVPFVATPGGPAARRP